MSSPKHPHAITIHLTDEEYRLVVALSGAGDGKPSVFAREVVMGHVSQEWASLNSKALAFGFRLEPIELQEPRGKA